MQELSQWRNQKAEEAMRATVLDEATAARFSTAAALDAGKRRALGIDWRDSTLDNREVKPCDAVLYFHQFPCDDASF